MLISTTDLIPGKKIVNVLGEVHARNNPLGLPLDVAENAKKHLIVQAEKLGANAIVGFRSERQQYRSGTSLRYKQTGKIRYFCHCYGTAVIIENEERSPNTIETSTQPTSEIRTVNFCPQCGVKLKENEKVCVNCGYKLY